MRTRSVRVSALISGSTAATLPRRVSPGSAATRARATCPGAIPAACSSGKAASSHTVARPLMRASVMPASTVMPVRTISSLMRPPVGAVTVVTATGSPPAATRSISAAGMPSRSASGAPAATTSPGARA